MARNLFKDVMSNLCIFLEEDGFWDSEKENYMEMNENCKYLSKAVSDFLEKNPERKNYEFSVSSECIFESPGLEVYATSIALAYYDNKNLIVESMILDNYLY